jgi:CubicO group peptidase (beta-lactamase class C family)
MSVDAARLLNAAEECAARHGFSGVVRLAERGAVALDRCFGLANRADGIIIGPDTRFGMASGCKTFTAVAVCQLVDQGRLSFDSRLSDILDAAVPRFDPGITVHHLLSHTSGAPDYFDEETSHDYASLWADRPMYRMRRPRDFLPMFQDLPMKSAPGSRWSYNNAGYILLGLVVEAVSGMEFTAYVEDRVLRACGMADTGYFSLDDLPGRVALGYVPAEGGRWTTNLYSIPIVGGPDGGAFTTAPDLGRFWDALMGGRLLTAPTLRAMLQPHGRTDTGHYGYGLWLEDGEPGFAFQMIGEDPGVGFFSGLDPSTGRQLTVLGNVAAPVWEMARVLTVPAGRPDSSP